MLLWIYFIGFIAALGFQIAYKDELAEGLKQKNGDIDEVGFAITVILIATFWFVVFGALLFADIFKWIKNRTKP